MLPLKTATGPPEEGPTADEIGLNAKEACPEPPSRQALPTLTVDGVRRRIGGELCLYVAVPTAIVL